MSIPIRVKLFGISSSDYEIDGKRFSNTEFFIPLEMKSTANKVTIGTVTRGFKLGDASEIKKWEHLAHFLGDGKSIECDAEIDIVATKVAGKDTQEIQLASIRPVEATKKSA